MESVINVEKYVGAMITETYFNCPLCKLSHFVCIQNAKAREIKRAIDIINTEERQFVKDDGIVEITEGKFYKRRLK